MTGEAASAAGRKRRAVDRVVTSAITILTRGRPILADLSRFAAPARLLLSR
jgi:hypothetical protein